MPTDVSKYRTTDAIGESRLAEHPGTLQLPDAQGESHLPLTTEGVRPSASGLVLLEKGAPGDDANPTTSGSTGFKRLARTAPHPGVAFALADLLVLLVVVAVAPGHWTSLVGVWVVAVATFSESGLYRWALSVSLLDDIPILVRSALVVTLAASTYAALTPRDDLLEMAALAATLMAAHWLARCALYPWLRWARRRSGVTCSAIVTGTSQLTQKLIECLDKDPTYGIRPIGYVASRSSIPHSHGPSWKYLGKLEDLPGLVSSRRVEVLVIGDGDCEDSEISEILREPALRRLKVFVVPRLFEIGRRTTVRDHVGAIPLYRPRIVPYRGLTRSVKRILDVLLSASALVALAPILLIIALAVRLEGGPGVIFRQQRVGRDGRSIEVLKFRSMKPLNTTENEQRWSISDDPRIGPVGAFLRRTSLDELPQLINILRGDMAIVGPRPERPHFVQQFSSAHPHYPHRHRVTVGLTGLAQVNGLRGDTAIDDRARYDNYYIENWTLWLDFKVIARTVNEVVAARGR